MKRRKHQKTKVPNFNSPEHLETVRELYELQSSMFREYLSNHREFLEMLQVEQNPKPHKSFEETEKEVHDLLEIERAFKRPHTRKHLLKQQSPQLCENSLLTSVLLLQLMSIVILLLVLYSLLCS